MNTDGLTFRSQNAHADLRIPRDSDVQPVQISQRHRVPGVQWMIHTHRKSQRQTPVCIKYGIGLARIIRNEKTKPSLSNGRRGDFIVCQLANTSKKAGHFRLQGTEDFEQARLK